MTAPKIQLYRARNPRTGEECGVVWICKCGARVSASASHCGTQPPPIPQGLGYHFMPELFVDDRVSTRLLNTWQQSEQTGEVEYERSTPDFV